jgi:hypothetical protein
VQEDVAVRVRDAAAVVRDDDAADRERVAGLQPVEVPAVADAEGQRRRLGDLGRGGGGGGARRGGARGEGVAGGSLRGADVVSVGWGAEVARGGARTLGRAVSGRAAAPREGALQRACIARAAGSSKRDCNVRDYSSNRLEPRPAQNANTSATAPSALAAPPLAAAAAAGACPS